jgi:UDP-N-acetylglucosamine 2-epimerase (non-hydrolysing)
MTAHGSIPLWVVLGTRPEAVKLAPLLHALQREPWCRVTTLATGQHQELLADTLAGFGLAPDIDLSPMQPGQSVAALASRTLAALDERLAAAQGTPAWPRLVLAQGDTSSVLAAGLSAFWRQVPFAHIEAGLRTGDLTQPFPEEAHRSLVSRLAALHFAPTAAARANLLREGVDDSTIHVVGNTVIDALLWAAARAPRSAHAPADGRRLLLATVHRRENDGAPLREICRALRQLAARGDVQVLLPVHPRPEVQATVQAQLAGVPHIALVPPLPYLELVAALRDCALVLTDSGGLQEEAPALGKPVLVLRQQTERPEVVQLGGAQVVGTGTAAIVQAAGRLLDDTAAFDAMAQPRFPYGRGDAAERIVAVLRAHFGTPL